MTPDKANAKLLQAAKAGSDPIGPAKAALEAGAEVNVEDAWGSTPLHFAADTGYTDLARLLIEKGAIVYTKDISMMTPLHRAAERGHIDVVRLLIEKGADITAQDRFQKTPQERAADKGHTDVVSVLENAARQRGGHAERVVNRPASDKQR